MSRNNGHRLKKAKVICSRKGCKSRAKVFPVLLLKAVGYDGEAEVPLNHLPLCKPCGDHAVANPQGLTPDSWWERVSASIQEQGGPPPSKALTTVQLLPFVG